MKEYNFLYETLIFSTFGGFEGLDSGDGRASVTQLLRFQYIGFGA